MGVSRELKDILIAEAGGLCAYCLKQSDILQVEHIIPRKRGGAVTLKGNLTVACPDCNIRKGKKTAQEYGEKIGKDFSHLTGQLRRGLKEPWPFRRKHRLAFLAKRKRTSTRATSAPVPTTTFCDMAERVSAIQWFSEMLMQGKKKGPRRASADKD